jgi:hypothetical protein
MRSMSTAGQSFNALLAIGTLLIVGCTATSPMSITLYNPKTKVTRTCVARESAARQIEALSSAVEACAKQLEARGFVRVDSLPGDTADRDKTATIP